MRAIRRFLRRAAALAALGAIAAGGAVFLLRQPYGEFGSDGVFVDIAKGASTLRIAGQLEEAGVVRTRWLVVLARLLRPRARMEAGEYRFVSPASPWGVFGRLARGDVFYYELTVPEGDNLFDIAARVARLSVMPAEEFLAAAGDATSIRDLDPAAPSLEGYLFPSTYRLTRHTTARQLCRLMTAQFRREWQLLPSRPADPHDVVTLASLVEKETANADERPLIASVFENRMRLGMTLDCDPTTIYAALLDNRYRGAIHRSDLANRNSYNTYQHAGLPPGPIANPGLASLRAALKPAASDYLYFVARPDGSGHRFSRTIQEHNVRVKEYRRGIKEKSEGASTPRVSRAAAAGKSR